MDLEAPSVSILRQTAQLLLALLELHDTCVPSKLTVQMQGILPHSFFKITKMITSLANNDTQQPKHCSLARNACHAWKVLSDALQWQLPLCYLYWGSILAHFLLQ